MVLEKIKQRIFDTIDPWIPRVSKVRPIPSWTTGYTATNKPVRRAQRWDHLQKPFTIQWFHGIKIYIYPGEEISRCLYVEGFYEPNQMCFLDSYLKPGMTVMDVGAHNGIYSLFCADKVGVSGKVLALEPSRREFEKLRLNISINQFQNIRIFHVAAYDSETTLDLKIAKTPHTGHNTLGNFAYQETTLDDIEAVQTSSLNQFIQTENLERVDLIKIDAEGSEMNVLRGAENILEKFHPVLLLEIFPPALTAHGDTAADIWSFLTGKGYHFFVYDPKTGIPAPVNKYPGLPHTDFIASKKIMIEAG